MKHRIHETPIFRGLVVPVLVASLALMNGCGGSSSSPGTSGPATVSVSVASAPSFPAGTTFAPSTLLPSTEVPANSPEFTNVFVWVRKIALIPSNGAESPDGNGELEQVNSSAEEGRSGMPGFATITLPDPVRIDLLNTPTGRQVAWLLSRFSDVPVAAGEYSKIRVYYDNVVGCSSNGDNTTFHPTAHYHFDVHFVGGNLVIPVAAPQDENLPQEGIRFYSIVINVVGLKYHQAGSSGNVLLRPQVFAEFVPPVLYSLKGTARHVDVTSLSDPVSGDFTVEIGGMESIPVTFDNNTAWAYSDNVLHGSIWKILEVSNQKAVEAFQDRAEVKVIGWFDGGTFRGTDIMFTFPDVRQGTADNVWILGNTAFIVRSLTDNVTVFPKPDRMTAYYDNLANPRIWLSSDQAFFHTDIDDALQIRARGYFADVEEKNLWAYWISVGP